MLQSLQRFTSEGVILIRIVILTYNNSQNDFPKYSCDKWDFSDSM